LSAKARAVKPLSCSASVRLSEGLVWSASKSRFLCKGILLNLDLTTAGTSGAVSLIIYWKKNSMVEENSLHSLQVRLCNEKKKKGKQKEYGDKREFKNILSFGVQIKLVESFMNKGLAIQ
jgi:hypothetical protein